MAFSHVTLLLATICWASLSFSEMRGLLCHSVPQVNLAQPAEAIHNWIRGHDKVPGAWTVIGGQVCFLEHTREIQARGML